MAVNDVYEVIVKGAALGRDVLNRFHYLQTGGTAASSDLATILRNDLVPLIMDVLGTEYSGGTVTVTNVSDPSDQSTSAFTDSGSNAGGSAPLFTAAVLDVIPLSAVVRQGRKAFSPVLKADIVAEAIGSVTQSGLNALISYLLAEVVDSVTPTNTWEYSMYSPANLTHPGVDVVSAIENIVIGGASTQNTRKSYSGS